MGPVCILLGGVITLGMLNHSNELIALKACGLSLWTIVRPVIAGAMGITLLYLAMAQFLLPHTVSRTNFIWNQEVRGRVPLGIFRNGRYYYRGSEGFYSFGRPYADRTDFVFFTYTVWTQKYRLGKAVSAEWAHWKNGVWTLDNGQVQTLRKDGSYTTEVFKHRTFPFPEAPSSFFISRYRALEQPLTGLYLDAVKRRDSGERRQGWADLGERLSYFLVGLGL